MNFRIPCFFFYHLLRSLVMDEHGSVHEYDVILFTDSVHRHRFGDIHSERLLTPVKYSSFCCLEDVGSIQDVLPRVRRRVTPSGVMPD